MSTQTNQPAGSYQSRVKAWLLACFGKKTANSATQRTYRFAEESIELAQAMGCTKADYLQLVDYVFDRPIGEKKQEVGGVMVTLAGLCSAADIDLEDAAETELARVWEKIPQIRAKHLGKPKGSPLAEHVIPPVEHQALHTAPLFGINLYEIFEAGWALRGCLGGSVFDGRDVSRLATGEFWPPYLQGMRAGHQPHSEMSTSDAMLEMKREVRERLDMLTGQLAISTFASMRSDFYIAGPMSGLPNHNFPAFHAAAAKYRQDNVSILSPAELHAGAETEADAKTPEEARARWQYFLRRDIAGMLTCGGVILLPGWQNSRGARLEKFVADILGLKTIYSDGAVHADSVVLDEIDLEFMPKLRPMVGLSTAGKKPASPNNNHEIEAA